MAVASLPSYLPTQDDWTQPFWQSLKQGVLLIQRCEHCAINVYPPVEQKCGNCGTAFQWRQASGEASLWSWVTIHREYYPDYPLTPPYTVLMVQLKEGIKMLASLTQGAGPSELRCDLPLQFSPLELLPGRWVPAYKPRSEQCPAP